VPEHAGAAAVGLEQRREHLDRRRLPRPVRPEHAVHAALRHGQVDTVHRPRGFERLDESFGFDRERHRSFRG
jgi:hypothetical protein